MPLSPIEALRAFATSRRLLASLATRSAAVLARFSLEKGLVASSQRDSAREESAIQMDDLFEK